MLRNVINGQPLVFKAQLWETLLQFLAITLMLYHNWDLLSSPYFVLFVQLIAGILSVKISVSFIARYLLADDSLNNSFKTVFLAALLNATSGLLWGCGLVYLSHEIQSFNITDPWTILIIISITIASFIGSAFHAKTFLYFVVPGLIIPSLWLVLYDPTLEHSVLWGTLSLLAIIIANFTASVESVFEKYRDVGRQDVNLLKELATAKEQALRDQYTVERANESLKVEMAERKTYAQKILASEKETARILQDMIDTYFRIDKDGLVLQLSPSIRTLLGFNKDQCIGKPFSNLFSNIKDFSEFKQKLEEKGGILQNHEIKLKHTLGHHVWSSMNAHFSTFGSDEVRSIEGTIRDITDIRQAAEKLFQEKDRLHVTLESIGDGVITTNMNGYVEYLNPVAEKMMGWDEDEARGKHLATIFHLIDEANNKPVALPFRIWLSKGRKASLSDPTILVSRHKDRAYTIELSGTPIRDSAGIVIGAVLVFHNVTKLRTLAQQLSHQASHDTLTGLINRREFDIRVEEAIKNVVNHSLVFSICYIDLDQFKVVNDTCGHHAGDKLLIKITSLMQDCLRTTDTLARLGGDEFGVLLNECGIDNAAKVAEKIRHAVEQYKFIWDNQVFRIGASIGVVPITTETQSLTELLSAADSACYVAKERGRNQVHIYTQDDKHIAQHHGQMHWMQRIQSALEDDRFELHFQTIQPISDESNHLLSGEVLLRMVDENQKLIMPNMFIPAAERYQLMSAIDKWVLRRALQTLSNQQESEMNWDMCTINLSGQSIDDKKILDYVIELINYYKVPPNILCFEITESAVISNLEMAKHFIKTLKDLGCRFALDDFGTGLSSFAYLKYLPVDYLKLDGEIVCDVASDPTSYAMVAAINNVAHVMNMKTIAEHVESDATLAALKEISVDYAQGYGIDIPVNFFWRTNTPKTRVS